MKTASRVLGSAFFLSGYEAQDAPRYGAERRGAPTFAYVRAARAPIFERGVIRSPDLVIVADDTLPSVPAAGVMQGVSARTLMLIHSNESAEAWKHRLNLSGRVLILPTIGETAEEIGLPLVGSVSAGAAARLVGVIERDALVEAVRREIAPFGDSVARENERLAVEAYERMAEHAGTVVEGGEVEAKDYTAPSWIDVPFEEAPVSAPAMYAGATSVRVKTGAWRTMRPVVEEARCNRCWWICSTYCPDSAISVSADNKPIIDYDHCKGCMICVAICPSHAIEAVPERAAESAESEAP
ncbi:MAG: 2-oxoacid:acceptor oxidoreductase family protein [Myxococcales bacterium]|nr:MAG: 2-oxoacid:acceptor oxidoreductase family protein [Myxococcales bacterium]